MSTPPHTLDHLRRELNQQLRHKAGWERFGDSVNHIAGLFSAIMETTDDRWIDHVTDLTEEEQKRRIKEVLTPYVPTIRALAPALAPPPSQKGGADPTVAPSALPTAPSALPVAPSALPVAPSALPAAPSALPAIDLDAGFLGLVEKTEQLDKTAEYLSSQYGLTRLEREFDASDDFHLVPEFLRIMIGTMGPTGMSVKTMLDKIKVPYRLIVFAIHLYLDISRLTAATMGQPTQQKTMTVILALLELFRGDWKKALLTFMGFYGTTPLLAGQIGKTFLYLFERLSPTIQDQMVFGAWDASKSLLVGLLLSLFQLTAPFSIRKPVMEVLETLSQGKRALDQSLIEAGMKPRSDEFEPTWENINRLQAVNRDPVFICSCEYQEVIKNIGDSALMKLILQLLGLPVNEEMKEKYTCVGRMPCRPYLEALKEEQTEKGALAPAATPSPPDSAPAATPAAAPAPAPAPAPSTPDSTPVTPSLPPPPAYNSGTPLAPPAPAPPVLPPPPAYFPSPSLPTSYPQMAYPQMTYPQMTYPPFAPMPSTTAMYAPPPAPIFPQRGGRRILSSRRSKRL